MCLVQCQQMLVLVVLVPAAQCAGLQRGRAGPAQFVDAEVQVHLERQRHIVQRRTTGGGAFAGDAEFSDVQRIELQTPVEQALGLPCQFDLVRLYQQAVAFPAQHSDMPALAQ